MCSEVTLLDDAIKMLIVKQDLAKKRSYTRDQLIEIKRSGNISGPPKICDTRVLKSGSLKHFQALADGAEKISKSQTRSLHPRHTAPIVHSENNKYTKITGDKRQDVREYRSDHHRGASKPEWFTDGPTDIDDQMDFEDMKLPPFDDRAICKIQAFETSNKAECVVPTTKPLVEKKPQEENVCVIVREPFNQKLVLSEKQKQEKGVRIFTLRDIETDLHVRKTEHATSNDLTAFYKLLELVGMKVDRRSTSVRTTLGSRTEQLNACDNNLKSTSPLKSEKFDLAFSPEGKKSSNDLTGTGRNLNFNTANHVPSHVLNHGNIRHNTNAASASAFISQKMETSTSTDAEKSTASDCYDQLQNYVSGLENQKEGEAELLQQSAEYNFVQNPPFAAPAGFPIGFGVNRMANSLFPALAFHNTNKYLTRQHLQPFVLQQILQQQHLAKYGYWTDSALNLMSLRNNSAGLMGGYHHRPHAMAAAHLELSAAAAAFQHPHLHHHQQQFSNSNGGIFPSGTGGYQSADYQYPSPPQPLTDVEMCPLEYRIPPQSMEPQHQQQPMDASIHPPITEEFQC